MNIIVTHIRIPKDLVPGVPTKAVYLYTDSSEAVSRSDRPGELFSKANIPAFEDEGFSPLESPVETEEMYKKALYIERFDNVLQIFQASEHLRETERRNRKFLASLFPSEEEA